MAQELARVGVLISGRGSNMQAIVAACREGRLPARVATVISNKADAPGVAWAESEGIPVHVISHREFASREAHDRAVVAALREHDVEWVCLAGYMRLLSRELLIAFPNHVLNIHPSLLPAFPGLEAQHQAWEYGARVSGCTVHLVDEELDHGPIVVQRTVRVEDGDTAEALSDRILEQEHVAYVEALERLLTEDWRLENRRLVFVRAS